MHVSVSDVTTEFCLWLRLKTPSATEVIVSYGLSTLYLDAPRVGAPIIIILVVRLTLRNILALSLALGVNYICYLLLRTLYHALGNNRVDSFLQGV
jgi:hypothetical protein